MTRGGMLGFFGLIMLALLACKGTSAEAEKREAELREREKRLEAEKRKLDEKRAESMPGPAVPLATPAATGDRPKEPPSVTARQTTVVVKLTIDMQKASGQPWDVGGDAPDPLITASGEAGSGSASFKDALTPTARIKLTLRPNTPVTVNVVDQDLAAHDPISNFTVTYKGPGGSASGKAGAAQYSVTFE